MLFSVIYSVDVLSDEELSRFAPPDLRLWDVESSDEDGQYRKWSALLTRGQFDEFIEHCGLTAEESETSGSVSAPGFPDDWTPTIYFSGDNSDAIQSADVTPVIETDRQDMGEIEWDRLRFAVLAIYG